MDEYVIAEKIFTVGEIWNGSSRHASALAAQSTFTDMITRDEVGLIVLIDCAYSRDSDR